MNVAEFIADVLDKKRIEDFRAHTKGENPSEKQKPDYEIDIDLDLDDLD